MNTSKKTFSIKSWAIEDRPREKLVLKGKESLSNAELLAILIGSGNREESAVALSKRILASFDNNLNALGKTTLNQLTKFKGIGQAKAITVISTLELGRRRRLEKALEQDKITNSNAVFEIMQPLLGELLHEEFWILLLNNFNKVIEKIQLSKGGLTSTVVDIRLVFKQAIAKNATGIIVCHNHPSGNLIPSEQDKKLTTNLLQAGKTLDIKVFDHVIITEKAYFSFADEGIL